MAKFGGPAHQVSFPAADKMIMRFRAVERAIAATLFFAPRFGQNAVPDRFRILNRLVTAEEVQREAHYCDMLLDQLRTCERRY